jgi:hypothetical protein
MFNRMRRKHRMLGQLKKVLETGALKDVAPASAVTDASD